VSSKGDLEIDKNNRISLLREPECKDSISNSGFMSLEPELISRTIEKLALYEGRLDILNLINLKK
jgi:hypothetical protein